MARLFTSGIKPCAHLSLDLTCAIKSLAAEQNNQVLSYWEISGFPFSDREGMVLPIPDRNNKSLRHHTSTLVRLVPS